MNHWINIKGELKRRLIGTQLSAIASSKSRLIIRNVESICKDVFPEIKAWPKIFPIRSLNKDTYIRSIKGIPIIIYDEEYSKVVSSLILSYYLYDNPIFLFSQFLSYSAERSYCDGNFEQAMIITQSNHYHLNQYNKRTNSSLYDNNYLFRPNYYCEDDLFHSFVHKVPELVEVFILCHELGHHLSKSSLSDDFKKSFYRVEKLPLNDDDLVNINNFITPELRYFFDKDGSFLKAGSYATDKIGIKHSIDQKIREEFFADYIAIMLMFRYTNTFKINPELLFDFLPLMALMSSYLSSINSLLNNQPNRNDNFVLTFNDSRYEYRLRILYLAVRELQNVNVSIHEDIIQNIDSESFDHFFSKQNFFTTNISNIELFRRRAMFNVVNEKLSYNKEMVKVIREYNERGVFDPLQNDDIALKAHMMVNPDYFNRNYIVDSYEDDLRKYFALIAMANSFEELYNIIWNHNEVLDKYGNHYLNIMNMTEKKTWLDLVKKPKYDIQNRIVTFPPFPA